MALILDATIGGDAANSYSTRLQATEYHEGRLFATAWTGASTGDQDAALVWATRLLDNHFDWTAGKYTLTQALRWPRFGALDRDGHLIDALILPISLIEATAELARILIGSDRTLEVGTEGLKSLKVDVIKLEFDKLDRLGTIPDEVYQMIAHLGTLQRASASGAQVTSVALLRT